MTRKATDGPTPVGEMNAALAPERIYFATSRARVGEEFGVEATEETLRRRLFLGTATALFDDDTDDWAYESHVCTGLDDFAAPGGTCARVLEAWLDEALAPGAVPLLSVHGFQYKFGDAVARTAQIAAYLREAPGQPRIVPLLFTWPSAGLFSLQAYANDREAARRAGPALARLLEELATRLRVRRRKVNLLAHSMGNWVVENGIATARDTLWAGADNVFSTVVLAAADAAPTVLDPGQPMEPLLRLADRVIVTVYRGDVTLTLLSGLVNHNGPRLGSDGPTLAAKHPSNLYTLDCVNVVQYDDLGRPPSADIGTDWNDIRHQYYRNQEQVRDALANALTGAKLPLANWRLGRPDPTIAEASRERSASFYYYATV